MQKTVYLYSGEGTRGNESGYKLLQYSAHWEKIETILQSKLNLNLQELWLSEKSPHHCPHSPLITTISQICLADVWQHWGYRPDIVLGHSTGEIAAAFQAGFYTLEAVLTLAYNIGKIGALLEGKMLHGWLTQADLDNVPVNISSFNFKEKNRKHVTLSGYNDELERYQKEHPDFTLMHLPHPWHHPDYKPFTGQLLEIAVQQEAETAFISGVTARFETRLKDDHWRNWLVSRIDFIKSIDAIKKRYGDHHLNIIEIGFHPVLAKSCDVFNAYTYVSSMYRGEDEIKWILHQRGKLDPEIIIKKIRRVINEFRPELDFKVPLAYQDFTSMDFVQLSQLLRPYFPGLAPQDFYRYKTIMQVVEKFGRQGPAALSGKSSAEKNGVVISGMSCRLPSSVETLPQFWEMLTRKDDPVRKEKGRGPEEAGYLDNIVSRFDHQFFNISKAEARSMDPQQALALELTEMLWQDAGIDPDDLDKQRVGVYIGAWNQEFGGDKTSVYYPTGINPSIIAARISYHYDLRGPSWVSNTACSSSLVAIHYAAKDIEAGRVDVAIAGGVNMLLDESFSGSMKNSGFLSADNRCKTFDDTANGYVRAEGGGLVLLVNKSMATQYYAEVIGSAINQNGGRAQVITAPHPEAQEELIAAACRDAGILPQEIAYVECHGTGTKIGDPIEMTAIQNTIARQRGDTLYLGSVKSNLGHLESAAGIAGVLKSVTALNHGIIPPNLHFQHPNQFIDFSAHPVAVVTQETPIDPTAAIGISSFGFGGTNAHILVKGAEAAVRKEIRPLTIPFDRSRAAKLSAYISSQTLNGSVAPAEQTSASPAADVYSIIKSHLFNVTGIEEIDPDVPLLEQGLDSMSATELFGHLQNEFGLELDIEILFDAPLMDQFTAEIEKLIGAGSKEQKAGNFSRADIDNMLTALFFQLTGIETIDPDIELTEQGLDSMSGAELISQMENTLKIEIGPDCLFEHPLKDQFVDEVHARVNQTIN